MDTNKINPQLISENLTELLTNSINISSLFAKVFYDTIPSDSITLSQYVVKDDGALDIENVEIKNVAQIQQELMNAIGSSVVQNIGSVVDNETIKLNSNDKIYVDGSRLSVSVAASATQAATASLAETIKNALVGSSSPLSVWVGTQDEYDNLTVDQNTLYFIQES